MLINGRPVLIRGVNRHEHDERRGKAITEVMLTGLGAADQWAHTYACKARVVLLMLAPQALQCCVKWRHRPYNVA